jgi:beta-aspartyl-peptidase (threonine type)
VNHAVSYRWLFIAAVFFTGAFLMEQAFARQEQGPRPIRIVIQGGAGTILKSNMTPELEQEYHDKLAEAITAGYNILKNKGTSLDAVEAAIKVMEDSPLFNAGKGAVFTHEGTNELDASIMEGKTLMAGAVAAVKHIKNPISLARLVMEKSPHVMMIGEGAEAFAKEQGMKFVSQGYFYTERRWKQLQEAIQDEKKKEGHSSPSDTTDRKHGTVGCVALDSFGNLAAGTSTGGITNKHFGRVGDSPMIGVGTYASNHTCAVSATGDGEYFIRLTVARDIAALMEYSHLPVQQAADEVIMDKLTKLGGTGGVIALDREGNFAMPFNTEGMYRAYIDENGKAKVKIYKE